MDAATGLVIGLPRRAPVPVHRRCTGSLALSHRLQQRFVHHSCNNARRRRLRSPRHLLCASLRISATGTVASPTSPPRAPRRTGVPQACVSRIAYRVSRIPCCVSRITSRVLRGAPRGRCDKLPTASNTAVGELNLGWAWVSWPGACAASSRPLSPRFRHRVPAIASVFASSR